ncbi:MAG: hypothetical protein HUU15_16230, partial [Candidatus Brocadiae bacterium]|nr:hypothetical protein [Candidatus Brocadiia bacterium]
MRGAAAVIITVLLLFALVALTLFGFTRLSPPEITSDAAGTRAFMLSMMGIERAMAELPRAASLPVHGSAVRDGEPLEEEFWTWWGEDRNANGALDAGEDVNGNLRLDVAGLEIGAALRPSFAEMEGRTPRGVVVDGKVVGVSGTFGGAGPASPATEHYVLRVTEAASRIWINGPPDATRRMVVHLVRRLGLPRTVAAAIAEARGCRTEEDLIPRIGLDHWRVVSPYLTTQAWVDADTLGACPMESRVRPHLPGDPVYSRGHLRPRRLVQQPRAPVNINSAPAIVLACVLEGLQGYWVEEGGPGLGLSGYGGGYTWMERPLSWRSRDAALGTLRLSTPVSAAQADALALAAVAARTDRPFRTWDDFRRFLDAQVRLGVIDAMQAEAVRANADPNSLLNDFNPDRNAWSPIDKTDLVGGTTEFAFASMGVFVVESLGRVTDPGGKVLAERMQKAHIRAWEVWRETTEAGFLRGVADGADPRTQISAFDGDGTTRSGLALEAWPEAPPWTTRDRNVISTLWYDGRIGLAPLLVPPAAETWLRASLTPPVRETLEADDWRVRSPSPDPAEQTARDRLARQPRADGEPIPGPLVIDAGKAPEDGRGTPVGMVFPDGASLEAGSCLRYRALDNLPSRDGQTRSGCVSFWFKPAFDPARSSRPRTLWSIDRSRAPGSSGFLDSPVFGAWLFPGSPASEGPYAYGFRLAGLAGFGIGHHAAADRPEPRGWVTAGIATGRAEFEGFAPLAWVHLAFAWDLDAPAPRAFRMAVNGRVVPAANAFEAIPGSLPLRERIDLAASAPGTSTWVSFGALASDPVRNLPLDGTIDEIRIGTAEAFEEARRDAAEGRYARVDDRTRPRRG